MTDDELIAHAHQSEGLRQLEQRVALARSRARILTAISVGLVCLVVLASVTFGFVLLADKGRSDTARDRADAVRDGQIDKLTLSLREAKDALAAATATNSELDDCTNRFDGNVSSTLSGYLASLGNLVVIIATVVPEDRAAKLGGAVDMVGTSLTAYQDAITDRSTWQDAGSTLPCPITP